MLDLVNSDKALQDQLYYTIFIQIAMPGWGYFTFLKH